MKINKSIKLLSFLLLSCISLSMNASQIISGKLTGKTVNGNFIYFLESKEGKTYEYKWNGFQHFKETFKENLNKEVILSAQISTVDQTEIINTLDWIRSVNLTSLPEGSPLLGKVKGKNDGGKYNWYLETLSGFKIKFSWPAINSLKEPIKSYSWKKVEIVGTVKNNEIKTIESIQLL